MFFTEIGTKLSRQLQPPINKSYKDILIKYVTIFSNFKMLMKKQTIPNIIDKLSLKNSFGFDGISTK